MIHRWKLGAASLSVLYLLAGIHSCLAATDCPAGTVADCYTRAVQLLKTAEDALDKSRQDITDLQQRVGKLESSVESQGQRLTVAETRINTLINEVKVAYVDYTTPNGTSIGEKELNFPFDVKNAWIEHTGHSLNVMSAYVLAPEAAQSKRVVKIHYDTVGGTAVFRVWAMPLDSTPPEQ